MGASKGKHSTKGRTYFSGKRVRRVDTRLGTIYLFIPKLKKGGYIPFYLTQKKRSEAALMALIHEAFINGVSTRKIERLARYLGICKWWEKSLTFTPYLFLRETGSLRCEPIREPRRVKSWTSVFVILTSINLPTYSQGTE